MQHSLMQQGVDLLIFGMGTVFIFLAVLVIATAAMSKLVQRFDRPAPVASQPGAEKAAVGDAELIAVISAAVKKHRSRRN